MMRNKVFITGMISILLVFGFMFVACSEDSGDTDTWSAVEDIGDLTGTWKGSTTIPIPAQDLPMDFFGDDPLTLEIPKSSMKLQLTIEYPADANVITVTTKSDTEWLLDAMVKSDEFKMLWQILMGFSGQNLPLNKENLWKVMNEDNPDAEPYWESDTITVPKDSALTLVSIEKNQDDNKVKVAIPVAMLWSDDDDVPLELDGDTIEIILQKQ
jgi:hypothetical protein